MQIQYEHLDYQNDAIYSIVDLFKGEMYHAQDGFSLSQENHDMVIANDLKLSWETIAENLHTIQEKNQLAKSDIHNEDYNFTVEMETGTGKTYVYLRTILELNKQYGWRKFIIVVPSVAIREGVIQTLKSTKSHFEDEFNKVVFKFEQYDSTKNNILKNFATSTNIEILVMNIQAFEKDVNVINQNRESGKLIDYIQSVRPIVIIDEPQNLSSENRKQAIQNLNPLFTVGYSATHKEHYHKVYSLNPVQAYELNLVKQIAVRSVMNDDNHNSAFVELVEIVPKGKGLQAKIKIDVNDGKGVKRKAINVKKDDDLYVKSGNNPIYEHGFVVNGLDFEHQQISLSNGLIIGQNHALNDMQDEIMKAQIRETIREHLQREKTLNLKGIKVLSLFFIDKVANYRSNEHGEKGKFCQWFEEIYEQETGQSADDVHKGYFSQDKHGFKDTNGTTQADNDAYNLIMKAKERLLDLKTPLRFIFSHSALREGWDNPNVFQICTLNETASTIKKRQEIGRGLRLPVNQFGERIYDKEVNILTVIPNQSYESFARDLQIEYENECGIKFEKSNIKNAKNQRTVTYRSDIMSDPLFLAIWQRIRQKTYYQVNYDSEKLIAQASKKIKAMPALKAPSIQVQKAMLQQTMQDGVTSTQVYEHRQQVTRAWQVPDILKLMQDRTGLTRKTLLMILKQSQRIDDIKINPQKFIDVVSEIINHELQQLMVNGICYHKIDGENHDLNYQQELVDYFSSYQFFKNEHTFSVEKIDKTIYNGYIPLDSKTEHNFASHCEDFDEQVKFYFKLPSKFKIPTPIGSYNPDWAVVMNHHGEQVYFIAETKNTRQAVQDGVMLEHLKLEEQMKIHCAKAFFDLIDDIDYEVVEKVGELVK